MLQQSYVQPLSASYVPVAAEPQLIQAVPVAAPVQAEILPAQSTVLATYQQPQQPPVFPHHKTYDGPRENKFRKPNHHPIRPKVVAQPQPEPQPQMYYMMEQPVMMEQYALQPEYQQINYDPNGYLIAY